MRLSYLLKPLSLSKGKKKGAHESEVPFLRVEWLRTLNFDAPLCRRSLALAPTKKSFVHNFLFAPARFFLLKGKQNFSLAVCSLRAGRRGFASARARRNSPHTPLPPRPRFERRRNLCQLKTGAPHLFFNFQKQ